MSASRIMRLAALFFFNDTVTTEIYTLSLHDALPISATRALDESQAAAERALEAAQAAIQAALDRRDELEGKIANYRTMQEQRRQRLEWVRGAKEASTLMAELDLPRSVLAKEEAEFMPSGDAGGEA